jgi:metallo-beta-lactamase family protein
LFTGFQAAGTRGRSIVDGAISVKIHGQNVPIRASVHNIDALSAHADADEILAWLRNFRAPPRRTFIVHGEPNASAALQARLSTELGWNCVIPSLGEEVSLT